MVIKVTVSKLFERASDAVVVPTTLLNRMDIGNY